MWLAAGNEAIPVGEKDVANGAIVVVAAAWRGAA